VVHAVGEFDTGQRLLRFFEPLFGGSAVVDERQFDVVQRSGARKQVEGLEDEADFLVANIGELVVIEFADQPAGQPILPGGRRVEASNQIH